MKNKINKPTITPEEMIAQIKANNLYNQGR